MKNKLWILQLPWIAVCTAAYLICESGYQGNLDNAFLRERIFPYLKSFAGKATDLKFSVRGPEPVKNKIIIVDFDNRSIDAVGRWPWRRNYYASLLQTVTSYQPKAMGLDITFSEASHEIPTEIKEALTKNKLMASFEEFDYDRIFAQEIGHSAPKLVTGWMYDVFCQPRYEADGGCTKENVEKIPAGFQKFSFKKLENFEKNFGASAMTVVGTFIANLPQFNLVAQNSGYLNNLPDRDFIIRHAPLFIQSQGQLLPSLALAISSVVLGKKPTIELTEDGRIAKLQFEGHSPIPISPLGSMQINFRGNENSLSKISAADILQDNGGEIEYRKGSTGVETTEKAKLADLLSDAIILFGVSATGIFDMRAFPTGDNIPGVQGHAHIIDNILSGDMLDPGYSYHSSTIILILLTLGALVYSMILSRFEAIGTMAVVSVTALSMGALDTLVLFKGYHQNWNTVFLMSEFVLIFITTFVAKYLLEEQNKKFVREAFSKYVAPAVVDAILKDPGKLSLGGERRELTILFSDIRSFTTMSEKLDAKQLATFLNDYLGIMTDILFKHQGTLDKYIGDAIMGFWGAPLNQPNHAQNALNAAKEMQERLAQERPRFLKEYGVDVAIGAGLNTGVVNVGNMGSSSVFEYTVIGDHVNLASRLEGLTKYYGANILTTRFTFDSLHAAQGSPPPHRTIDFVKVKGKKQAVELIQIFDEPYSNDAIQNFEEARKAYTSQQFEKAIVLFDSSQKARGKTDETCEMMIERCREMIITPPAKDWDGAWVMTSK